MPVLSHAEGLTVACVLWRGAFKNRVYEPAHVARLERMVRKQLVEPHRFVCLSNTAVPCERIVLREDWPGWWAKLELFRPGLFGGRVVYLDLDVTVVGNLDALAGHPATFVAIRDWLRPGFNSSVMAWDAGVADALHTAFSPGVMTRLEGDQDWLAERLPAATFPPEWCVSYRKHCQCRLDGPPPGARVIVSHGFPKPWDLPERHWLHAA